MLSARISLIAGLALILLAALVLTAVGGCAGANAMPLPTAMVQNVAPMPTVAELATPTNTDVPAPAPVTVTSPVIGSDFQTTDGSRTPTIDPTLNLQREFPLALSNTWVYQSTRYEAVPITEFITTTHVITETVVEVKSTYSYFAAKIHRDESAETPVFIAKSRQGEPLRPATSTEYWLVVMGNQIFRQEGNLGQPNLGKTDSRELLFPLRPGNQWYLYEAKDPGVPGGVSGLFRQVLKAGTVEVPAGSFDNCFFLKDDWATNVVGNWFCPGVGWVELKDDHSGTPYGSHDVLLRYHLSRSTSGERAGPTLEGKPALTARATLERFMQARIDRNEPGVLDLLTEQLQAKVMRGLPVDVPLTQVSNPCWYRYLVLTLNQTSAAQAQARVRIYEHQWPGDNAGSLPRSWEQEIGLTETTAGWRVDALGEAENEHQEPNEPHGPTLSACTAWRQTPANANPTLTPP